MRPADTPWRLPVHPLTARGFAPFGDVIEAAAHRAVAINDGTCLRHDDLARPSAAAPGCLALSLFDAAAAPRPCAVHALERHRLGSQAFAPFAAALRMLVVVADAALAPQDLAPGHLHAFVSNGRQGIHLRPGVWPHPLLSLEAGTWLVADRVAAPVDCDVLPVQHWRLYCAV